MDYETVQTERDGWCYVSNIRPDESFVTWKKWRKDCPHEVFILQGLTWVRQ